jgi:hypothetical protein
VDRLGGRVPVDELLVADARQGAADHVAGDVAAGALDREADAVQPLVDLGDVVERDPVDLDALPRRAVEEAAAEVGGDARDRVRLLTGEHALDDLDAQHEVAVLGVVGVQTPPLQARHVVVVERLPALVRGSHELRVDVEPVLLLLDALDLVHGPSGCRGRCEGNKGTKPGCHWVIWHRGGRRARAGGPATRRSCRPRGPTAWAGPPRARRPGGGRRGSRGWGARVPGRAAARCRAGTARSRPRRPRPPRARHRSRAASGADGGSRAERYRPRADG